MIVKIALNFANLHFLDYLETSHLNESNHEEAFTKLTHGIASRALVKVPLSKPETKISDEICNFSFRKI
jgi:hypothetical protein